MRAHCNGCGQPVMPYARYLFYSRPTAVCESCGARVRLRGFPWLVVSGFVLLAALFGVVFVVDSKAAFLAATVVLMLLALAVDYGGYRALSWDPIAEGSD